MLTLRKAEYSDMSWLAEILEAAFDFDTALYFGEGNQDGPPGYKDGMLAKKIMKQKKWEKQIICQNKQPVGVIVYECFEGENEVHYFCINPHYIGQGIGTKTWEILENSLPNNTWVLETPDYSKRNHSFYQKLGFIQVAEKQYGEFAKSFVFKKGSHLC